MTRGSSAKPPRPRGLEGSPDAKRQGAVVLEVLCGLRDARDGAKAMGVSANRYYQLELRALQGLISALEPRPKGRRWTAEERLALADKEKRRLEREVGRLQALLRAAQRSLGVPAFARPGKGGKLADKGKARGVRRRLRSVARGLKRIEELQQAVGSTGKPSATKKAPAPPAAKASS
jgi:hypothetical protein